MINSIPVIGWVVSFALNISLAIPFWVCWTCCEIGSSYFSFLPAKWQSIPFWSCVGIFISVSIIKTVFVPKLATVSQSADSNKA